MEDYLSYWSTEVASTNFTIETPYINMEGTPYISSANDAKVTIKLRNPKRLILKMPPLSDKVIRFSGLSPQPQHGTAKDYTLEQTAPDTLTLTYHKDFLEKYEWGTGDIGADITFIANDSRVFDKRFSVKLKVNTPPPAIERYMVAKTAGSPSYYVLCLSVPVLDMETNVSGKRLHKDIASLLVDDSAIPLTVNGTDFDIHNSGGRFLDAGSVIKLDAADVEPGITPDEPPTGNWVIRFKTDVEVKGAKKAYAFKLLDETGLSSPVITADTAANKLPPVNLYHATTEITGTSEADPYSILGMAAVPLQAKTKSGAQITGAVYKKDSSNWNKVKDIAGTTTADFDVPALGSSETEAVYKVTVRASGTGYIESDDTECFIKLLTAHTITGTGNGDWERLKEAVEKTPEGGAIIIDGQIKATNDPGNNGEIVIKKNLIIQGKRGNTTDNLNANALNRIFTIKNGKKLTLNNLTLQKGKPGGTGDGGAVLIEAGGALTLSGCIIEDCEAANGGAVYAAASSGTDAVLTVKNCTLRNNKATNGNDGGGAFCIFGGTVNISESVFTKNTALAKGGAICAQSTPSVPIHLTIAGGTIGGLGTDGNTADNNGGGIYFGGTDDSTLTLSHSAAVTGNKSTYGSGGGIFLYSGVCTLDDAVVQSNTAAVNGTGGIYVYKPSAGESILKVKGGTKIGSIMPGSNAVYLGMQPASSAFVTAEDLDGSAYINIRPHDYQNQQSMKLVEGVGAASYKDYFHLIGIPAGEEWTLEPNESDMALTLEQTITASLSNAWEVLKNAVEKPTGPRTIRISGAITAGTSDGTITVQRPVTIQSKTGADTDKLDAGGHIRIFKVTGSGTLTLKNLTLTQGLVSGNGGAIEISAGTTAELKNCIVADCAANYGGAIYNEGMLTITGGVFKKNGVSGSPNGGGAVYSRGQLSIDGTMFGGESSAGNKAVSQGGALWIAGGTCAVKGAVITHNEANIGGGIYVSSPGTCTIEKNGAETGTTIADNKAVNGGGLYIGTGCTVTIKEKTVIGGNGSGNSATASGSGGGGGIFVQSGGTCTIEDGVKISHNTAVNASGGGIFVDASGATKGKLTIDSNTGDDDDTAVSNNEAKKGGGIYNQGDLTIRQGKITGNKAGGDGGGLYNKGYLTMQHANITGNTAAESGGGIYSEPSAATAQGYEMTISNTEISGNTAKNQGAGLALRYTSPAYITADMTAVTVSRNTLTGTQDAQNTKGGAGIFFLSSSQQSKLTVQDGEIRDNDAGVLSGGGIYINREGIATYFSTVELKGTVKIAGNKAKKGGGIAVKGGKLELIGGVIGGNTEEDANRAEQGSALYAGKESVITMQQNGQETAIRGNEGKDVSGERGAAVHIEAPAQFDFSGGFIENNKGSGVCMAGSALGPSFSMTTGAVIRNNTAKKGGGVRIDAGTFTMSDGEISGNTAEEGGGAAVAAGGTFTMNNGSITGNTAESNGKAVSVFGTFNWNGGTISENKGTGDVIYKDSGGTFNNTSGHTAT